MKYLYTTIILLFSIPAFSQIWSPKTDTSTVSYYLATTLDTVAAGKQEVVITNTGATNALVMGDTLRPTYSLKFEAFYDRYKNRYFVLPQITSNPNSGELSVKVIE